MPKYGHIQKSPSKAPQTSMVVLSPVNNKLRTRRIPAVLDSGSARTCVPKKDLESLGEGLEYDFVTCACPIGAAEDRRKCVVHVRISPCRNDFKDVEVIEVDRNYALIGRDILNKYKLVLDGPRLVWTHL
jgi:hypothetical protein